MQFHRSINSTSANSNGSFLCTLTVNPLKRNANDPKRPAAELAGQTDFRWLTR